MCGIAGLHKFGDEPITKGQVQSLLLAIERRGNDATGIAALTGSTLSWLKNDEPAQIFLKDKTNDKWIDEVLETNPDTVILHTRLATQGTPRKNINNHPMTNGTCAVVHNGMISNDDFLFKDLKLERSAETDSDIIRAIIDSEGLTKKAIRTLSRMSGSAAIAVVHREFPKHFLLARSGNPLIYAITKSGLMMWASEKQAIHKAQRSWEQRYGVWVMENRADMKWASMPDNTAYLFGPEGLLWHDSFNVAYSYTAPIYKVNERYYEKQKKWDDEKIEAVKEAVTQGKKADWVACPSCDWVGPIPDKYKDKKLSELVCPKDHNLGMVVEGKKTGTDGRPLFD